VAEKLLHVLMHGQPMAQLHARGSRVTFTYEDDWLARPDAFPLSISLPLAAKEHPDRACAPYLWNLLPDNHETLMAWTKRFNTKLNPFELLQHVGEDVAGAAQFVRPERLEVVQNTTDPEVHWINETEIARRLSELRIDRSAWSQPGDVSYFSLSGAQPKMALLRQRGRWGIPSGGVPTTHILKPPGIAFEGFAENEHFCVTLARSVGLPVAESSIHTFESEVAFVTARFDRVSVGGKWIRVPAEDMCQALGIHPESKYQNSGGPGPEPIFQLLTRESSRPDEDCATFFDALAFNALIGGTDAHAKNYTLLHGGGCVRFAPLYDIASALPYYSVKQLKLAMKIGRHYELAAVNARDWDKVGVVAGLQSRGRDRVRAMAERLIPEVARVVKTLHEQGLAHKILGTLRDQILKHLQDRLRMLDAADAADRQSASGK
jgi:serine/threonine-protein kinase HipA